MNINAVFNIFDQRKNYFIVIRTTLYSAIIYMGMRKMLVGYSDPVSQTIPYLLPISVLKLEKLKYRRLFDLKKISVSYIKKKNLIFIKDNIYTSDR